MGKFIVGYDDNRGKVLIGQEIASRYLTNRYITVGKVYAEWLNLENKISAILR